MTRLGVLVALVYVVLVGCEAVPQQALQKLEKPVYPSPPADPRIDYERTFLSNLDVEREDDEAAFRRMFTGEGRTGTGLNKPFSVAVHKGRVFVSDTAMRSVVVFDPVEARFFEIGNKGQGILRKPMGIDVDDQGNLYVCDATLYLVKVYTRDGEFLREIGEPELFSRPSDVAVTPDGSRVYVSDTGGVSSDKHQIMGFDGLTGEHLITIGKRGAGDGELNLPRELIVSPNTGLIYVVDGGNFRVQAFTQEGEFVMKFGEIGKRMGQFARPKGIGVDSDENIYVSDAAFGNFQIFNSQGQLLLVVGVRGAAGGPGVFMLPSGLDVDEDGRIYMVDQFARKVDVFRPHELPESEGYLSGAK